MKKVFKIVLIIILIYLTLTVGLRIVGFRTFKIPTGSMENTILMGSRIAVLEKVFKPQRYDIIVYRNPERDTISVPYTPQSYYSIIRSIGLSEFNKNYSKVFVPLKKREQWIGRCVGLPGDRIVILDSKLYVNDQIYVNDGVKKMCDLKTKNNARLSLKTISQNEINPDDISNIDGHMILPLTFGQIDNLSKISIVEEVQPIILKSDYLDIQIFPYDNNIGWNRDNFGELEVPKKGKLIALTMDNLPIYQRLIVAYEHNKMDTLHGDIIINGTRTDKYIPKMDYYFIVNDNRDCSLDSRYFGFLPEDHLFGRVILN